MRLKWMGILPMLAVISLIACHQGKAVKDTEDSDILMEDSCMEDTISEVEMEIEEAEAEDRVDGTFDDFLFAFTHSRKLFYDRIIYPLVLETCDGVKVEVRTRNFHQEFSFMEQDYYTVLYGNASQIEAEREDADSVVMVERIDLDAKEVRTYEFRRHDGKWKLAGMHDAEMRTTQLGDFLDFYAQFSADSVFQQEHIAQPLRLSMYDPEDEDSYIEGTIDAEQWRSFCSDVPCGVISNIHYGQDYGSRQVVMQKCGSASGVQEVFTFRREGTDWRLMSYEN